MIMTNPALLDDVRAASAVVNRARRVNDQALEARNVASTRARESGIALRSIAAAAGISHTAVAKITR